MAAQLLGLLRLALVVLHSLCGASTSRRRFVAFRLGCRRCCTWSWRSRGLCEEVCELCVAERRSRHSVFEVLQRQRRGSNTSSLLRDQGAVGVLGGHSTARLADTKPMRLDARAAARVFNCQYELFNSITNCHLDCLVVTCPLNYTRNCTSVYLKESKPCSLSLGLCIAVASLPG